jgi:uncharacterized membrane protein required for colicin V production
MPLIDIILICIISGFAFFGLWFGLVHTLGSLLGTVLGVYLASRYYEPVAEWLISATGWGDNFARVSVFIIAFLLINRLVGMVFFFIQKFTRIFTSLPIIKSIDRLLGGIFGLFEGVITIGIIIYFIDKFPLSDKIMDMLEISNIASTALIIATILIPLLPEALKVLTSTVETVEATVREQ